MGFTMVNHRVCDPQRLDLDSDNMSIVKTLKAAIADNDADYYIRNSEKLD